MATQEQAVRTEVAKSEYLSQRAFTFYIADV